MVALLAGCTTSAQPAIAPAGNATLALAEYEHTSETSAVETRTFWDRSKTWEDPGNQTATVTSQAHTYHNATGRDTVVVYTTPKKRYVGGDQIRSRSPAELALRATRSVETPPIGNETGPSYQASLLAKTTTVQEISHRTNDTTDYVAYTTRDDVIVIVVVFDGADRSSVDRVLENVTRNQYVTG